MELTFIMLYALNKLLILISKDLHWIPLLHHLILLNDAHEPAPVTPLATTKIYRVVVVHPTLSRAVPVDS